MKQSVLTQTMNFTTKNNHYGVVHDIKQYQTVLKQLLTYCLGSSLYIWTVKKHQHIFFRSSYLPRVILITRQFGVTAVLLCSSFVKCDDVTLFYYYLSDMPMHGGNHDHVENFENWHETGKHIWYKFFKCYENKACGTE